MAETLRCNNSRTSIYLSIYLSISVIMNRLTITTKDRQRQANNKMEETRRTMVSPVQMRSQACHQSPEISGPVQPHSTQLGELPELPSEFEEPEQNNCYVSQKNNHQSRKTNVLPDFQRNKEQRINFPPSSDPIWKNMNQSSRKSSERSDDRWARNDIVNPLYRSQARDSHRLKGMINCCYSTAGLCSIKAE